MEFERGKAVTSVEVLLTPSCRNVRNIKFNFNDDSSTETKPDAEGENWRTFELEEGEWITNFAIRTGKFAVAVNMMTNTGRRSGRIGGPQGQLKILNAEEGCMIVGVDVADQEVMPRVIGTVEWPDMDNQPEPTPEPEEEEDEDPRMARKRRMMRRKRQRQKQKMKNRGKRKGKKAKAKRAAQAERRAEAEAREAEAMAAAAEAMAAAQAAYLEQLAALEAQREADEALANATQELVEGGKANVEEQTDDLVNAAESLEDLDAKIREAFQAFADEYVEGSEVLEECPDCEAVLIVLVNEISDVYNDALEENTFMMLEYVDAVMDSAEKKTELMGAAESKEGLEEAVEAAVNETAEAFVEQNVFLTAVPEGSLDEEILESKEDYYSVWGNAKADEAESTVYALVEELRVMTYEAREALYMFELTDYQKRIHREAMEAKFGEMQEKIDELNGVDQTFLAEFDREDAIELIGTSASVASQDMGYYQTRCDHIQEHGVRPIHHGYSRLAEIRGRKNENVLIAVQFAYNDGTVRHYGTKGENKWVDPMVLEEGEIVVKCHYWEDEKKLGAGIRFVTNNDNKWKCCGEEAERALIGGLKKPDKKFNVPEELYEFGGMLDITWDSAENKKKMNLESLVTGNHCFPPGDYQEQVEDFHMEGKELVGILEGAEIRCLPLPFETITVVDGAFAVAERLMGQILFKMSWLEIVSRRGKWMTLTD